MRRFGLIGYPLSHSFSRVYFTEKFRKEGLSDCVYENFPLESIDELPGLLHTRPDLAGLNVTIPYKAQVIPYLHESQLPDGLSACNCIRVEGGKLTGYNTDLTGFRESFKTLLRNEDRRALVLGNGGATAAVVYALDQLGIAYHIVSRALHGRSSLVYADLNEDLVRSHSLIINTTPLGMAPRTEECPPIPYEHIGPEHYLFDVVYNPEETMFLRKGRERGARTRNGHEMLVIQAEESWKIWNG